jgi:hypothetical protein
MVQGALETAFFRAYRLPTEPCCSLITFWPEDLKLCGSADAKSLIFNGAP